MVPGALTAHRGDVARSVFIFTSRDEIQYSKISPIKLAGTVTTPWHPIPPFLTANTAESEFSVTDRFFFIPIPIRDPAVFRIYMPVHGSIVCSSPDKVQFVT